VQLLQTRRQNVAGDSEALLQALEAGHAPKISRMISIDHVSPTTPRRTPHLRVDASCVFTFSAQSSQLLAKNQVIV